MTNHDVLKAWLDWYAAIGADEAVVEAALDRFHAAPPRPAPVPDRPPPARPMVARSAVRQPPRPVPGIIGNTAAGTAAELAAACSTLDHLRAAVEAFDLCPLKATATRTVFSDGPHDAPVMVIGEAPGAEEDRIGRPFVGASGRLLDRMLNAVGLNRTTNVYITNVVFWRPPGNRPPTPGELALCLPFVERQIALLKPKVLILSGGIAAKTMLDRTDGISRFRGRWFTDRTYSGESPVTTIATFHPSYLLRSPGQKRDAWRDMLNVKVKLQELGISIDSNTIS